MSAAAWSLGLLDGAATSSRMVTSDQIEEIRVRLSNAFAGVLTQLGGRPISPRLVGINEIVAEHPDLRSVMKSNRQAGFKECGIAIATWPDGKDLPLVVGSFFIDRNEALKERSTRRIKQDFVVYWGPERKAWSCGGLPPGTLIDKTRKTIHEFCVEFAKDRPGEPYGCRLVGRKWISTNHHYADENDPNLPAEVEIRERIRAALEEVRADAKST